MNNNKSNESSNNSSSDCESMIPAEFKGLSAS